MVDSTCIPGISAERTVLSIRCWNVSLPHTTHIIALQGQLRVHYQTRFMVKSIGTAQSYSLIFPNISIVLAAIWHLEPYWRPGPFWNFDPPPRQCLRINIDGNWFNSIALDPFLAEHSSPYIALCARAPRNLGPRNSGMMWPSSMSLKSLINWVSVRTASSC